MTTYTTPMKKINDIIDEEYYVTGINVVDKNTKIDTLFGTRVYTISKNDIIELLSGKAITFNDGEYAHVIYLEEN